MKLRLKITKEGNVRFIAHLEYMRTLERALRRARLPVAWTEGFNPHIRLSLASALGLGIASRSEYAEVELSAPIEAAQAQQLLNATLPTGVQVLYADVVDRGPALTALLASAAYTVDLPCADPAAVSSAVAEYNAVASFCYGKKTSPKKPVRQIDLKEYVRQISCVTSAGAARLAFVSAVTPGGAARAGDVLDALNGRFALGIDCAAADIQRTGLYQAGQQPLIGEQ